MPECSRFEWSVVLCSEQRDGVDTSGMSVAAIGWRKGCQFVDTEVTDTKGGEGTWIKYYVLSATQLAGKPVTALNETAMWRSKEDV